MLIFFLWIEFIKKTTTVNAIDKIFFFKSLVVMKDRTEKTDTQPSRFILFLELSETNNNF